MTGEPITCPRCDDGRIEVSTKVYFDITGVLDENLRVMATSVEASHLNDHLDGEPFNIEGELYCGCDGCGREFLIDFAPELRARITRQGAPL